MARIPIPVPATRPAPAAEIPKTSLESPDPLENFMLEEPLDLTTWSYPMRKVFKAFALPWQPDQPHG